MIVLIVIMVTAAILILLRKGHRVSVRPGVSKNSRPVLKVRHYRRTRFERYTRSRIVRAASSNPPGRTRTHPPNFICNGWCTSEHGKPYQRKLSWSASSSASS